MNIVSITNATDIPVIETDVPHGFTNGEIVLISGVIRTSGDITDLLNGTHAVGGTPTPTTFYISGIYHGTFAGGIVVPLTGCNDILTFSNTASYSITHNPQPFNTFNISGLVSKSIVALLTPSSTLTLSANLMANASLIASNTLAFTDDLSIIGIESITDGYLIITDPEEDYLDSVTIEFDSHSILDSLKNQVILVLSDGTSTFNCTNFNIIDENTLEILPPLPDFDFNNVTITYIPTIPLDYSGPSPSDTYIDALGADNGIPEPVLYSPLKKVSFSIDLSGYNDINYDLIGDFHYEITDSDNNFELGEGSFVDGEMIRSVIYDTSNFDDEAVDFEDGQKTISISPIFTATPIDEGAATNVNEIINFIPGEIQAVNVSGVGTIRGPNAEQGPWTATDTITFFNRFNRNAPSGNILLIYPNGDTRIILVAHNTPEEVRLALRGAFRFRARIINARTPSRLLVRPNPRALGQTPQVASAAPRPGGGRVRPTTRSPLAGMFGATALPIGLAVLDSVESIPLNIRYRQGRLQVKNVIAVTDADRCGADTVIYYTPINSDDPSESQITLAHGSSTNEPIYVPYKIMMDTGVVSVLDLLSPSDIPFSFDGTKLPSTLATTDLIPFDIFVTSPYYEPLIRGTDLRNVRNPIDITPFDLPPATPGESIEWSARELAGSTRRHNIGPNPLNFQQLPRLFYMNWAHPASRRHNGIGHKLIFNANCGLSLYTKLTTENYITDGLPGFMTTASEAKNWKYLYLGTGVTIGGVVIVCPGTRLLVNYTNPIQYNDFKVENTLSWPIHRFARFNSSYPIKPDSPLWRHAYVEARESTDEMPVRRPSSGRCSIGVCGPIGIKIVNTQYNLNGQVIDTLKYPLNEANTCSDVYGLDSCTPTEIIMDQIHMSTATPVRPGFNITEVLATINEAASEPYEFNFCYVGTQDHYYFDIGIGYNTSSNPLTDRNTDLDIEDGSNGMSLLRRSPVNLDRAVRGFGMQGQC